MNIIFYKYRPPKSDTTEGSFASFFQDFQLYPIKGPQDKKKQKKPITWTLIYSFSFFPIGGFPS